MLCGIHNILQRSHLLVWSVNILFIMSNIWHKNRLLKKIKPRKTVLKLKNWTLLPPVVYIQIHLLPREHPRPAHSYTPRGWWYDTPEVRGVRVCERDVEGGCRGLLEPGRHQTLFLAVPSRASSPQQRQAHLQQMYTSLKGRFIDELEDTVAQVLREQRGGQGHMQWHF